MLSPYLNAADTSAIYTSTFAGLNRRARIGDGEFAEMVNMTSDNYPLLSPRKPRTIAQEQLVKSEAVDEETVEVPQNLNGILSDVGFAAVWGSEFHYMGKKVDGIELLDGKKNLVAMGANILIFPDAVWYNTVDGTHGEMNENADKYKITVHATKFLIGGAYIGVTDSFSLPVGYSTEKQDFELVSNVSVAGSVSALPDSIIAVFPTVLRFCGGRLYYLYNYNKKKEGTGVYDTFSGLTWLPLDVTGVEISYAVQGGIELFDTAKDATQNNPKSAFFINLWNGNERVMLTGSHSHKRMAFSAMESFGFFDIKHGAGDYFQMSFYANRRFIPVLDHVCVLNNRLWGCRYGYQVNSENNDAVVNEIYCSALGDFKTWALTSTTTTLAGDPWTASLGEYGAWTGCIAHRGYVLFFKENCIFRVSGTKPSNFSYKTIAAEGLTEPRSMAVVDEVLYYKGRNGVYAYDGSLPTRISDKLGDAEFAEGAVGGAIYGKYYLNMGGHTYVYDTRTGLWHEEGAEKVQFFTRGGGCLYGGIGNRIVAFAGSPLACFAGEREGAVEWSAETGDIGLDTPYQKWYKGFTIRYVADIGARMVVEISTDGGAFRRVADVTGDSMRTMDVQVSTPRCDHMRIRFSGKGDVKIYSIFYEMETASLMPKRRL